MYKLRIKVFLALIGAVFLVLIGKLFHLQILHGREYRQRAEEALRTTQVLPVIRGKITDREGRLLALDEPCFDFCLDYRLLSEDPAWARRQVRLIARQEKLPEARAAEVFQKRLDYTWAAARELAVKRQVDLDAEVREVIDRVAAVRRIVNRRRLEEVSVREEQESHAIMPGLDEATALDLKARADQMVGAEVRPSYKRWYPYGAVACHVIGLTGPVFREEIERLNLRADQAGWLERMRANYLPGDLVGKTGVEKMCEGILRGRRGYRRVRMSGETGEILAEEPSVNGTDVHLTLDVVLQRRLAEVFAERSATGSAVVLSVGSPDAPRCEVLALVSVPTYDLNRFTQTYPRLAADTTYLPLLNRAVTQRYQPGSTIKPLAALAALAEGAISLDTEINCRGYLHTPDAFRCWTWAKGRYGHGALSVTDGIKHSCNVFFYEVGERLGAGRLCDWFARFGLAGVPGTGLPEECPGTVPTEAWLRQRYGRTYRPGDARFMAVGQGLLTATPLHMANVAATIARDGLFVSPMLVLEGGPRQVRRKLPLAPEFVRAVRKGMYEVVNSPGGTAHRYFHGPEVLEPLEGIEIAGKTGTATTAPQRVDTNQDGRIDLDDSIVREGDTAWFVGYAPHDHPQIAFAVTVEYVEGGGGANAAPIAIELVRLCQRLGYVR